MPSSSQKIRTAQYLSALVAVIRVDGSAVTTSYAKTGLVVGQHLATVKKGTSADSNLVSIQLNFPLGLAPEVWIQEHTLDCVARLEAATTKAGLIQIRTLELDGTTAENDADFTVFVFGTKEIREGYYN